MKLFEDYVIKKKVNKSLLTEGFSIPIEYQVVFKRNLGRLLLRGETNEIILYLNGKPYKVQINRSREVHSQQYDEYNILKFDSVNKISIEHK